MTRHAPTGFESFAAEQAGVRKRAIAALLTSLAVLAAAWLFGAGWPLTPTSNADRLAFVFRCQLATGFVL